MRIDEVEIEQEQTCNDDEDRAMGDNEADYYREHNESHESDAFH